MLFDRFVESEGEPAARQLDKTDRDVLSVRTAVHVLLNTRSPFSASACDELRRRTVIDYGLPDFVHLSPLSRLDSQYLARMVHNTIRWHEPRLLVYTVTVETPRPCRDVLRVKITGLVRGEDRQETMVSFSVDVGTTKQKKIRIRCRSESLLGREAGKEGDG